MMVGTKAIATLSTGYLNALEYAKQRVQGADLTQMTDKTAPRVHDHPPPRRPPDADAAEGVRRGHARADAVHRHLPGRGADRRGRGRRQRRARRARQRPAAADRQGRRLGAGLRAAHAVPADLRRLRASCRTTRSSSTSGTPRSTACTRAPPRSRAWTCSSARSCATRGSRWAPLLERDQGVRRPARPGNGRLKAERAALAARGRRRRGHGRRRWPATRSARWRQPAEVYKAGLNTTRLLLALGDLVIGWLLARQAEVALAAPGRRARAATRPSTRARWPRRGSSPRPCCPGWPSSARSPRRPRWT